MNACPDTPTWEHEHHGLFDTMRCSISHDARCTDVPLVSAYMAEASEQLSVCILPAGFDPDEGTYADWQLSFASISTDDPRF